jgi:hypothetical protein
MRVPLLHFWHFGSSITAPPQPTKCRYLRQTYRTRFLKSNGIFVPELLAHPSPNFLSAPGWRGSSIFAAHVALSAPPTRSLCASLDSLSGVTEPSGRRSIGGCRCPHSGSRWRKSASRLQSAFHRCLSLMARGVCHRHRCWAICWRRSEHLSYSAR